MAADAGIILAPGRVPAGERIYAIGDVHGCVEQLATLHALIADDLDDRPIGAATLIHLGDLVDRGPDSAAVVELVGTPPLASRAEITGRINLMGNHERMMLDALVEATPDAASHWLENGGDRALRSWGASPRRPARTWVEAIPPGHVGLLVGLSLSARIGDYLFAHAGVRPGRPLAQQSADDLIWIREPFLSHAGPLGLGEGAPTVVVHGHTPVRDPTVLANRIGIDTGAVIGGRLTCAVLEGATLRFIFA